MVLDTFGATVDVEVVVTVLVRVLVGPLTVFVEVGLTATILT